MQLAESLQRARRGDRLAFADLVRAHRGSVYSLALRMLNDAQAAEDLAQDVFLQLYVNLNDIQSEQHLLFWLRQVAARRAIDRVRQRVDNVALDADVVPSTVASGDPLWQKQVQCMLNRLSNDARAVMVLRYQEDLDPLEIARILAMPVATVKSHLKRSLASMRDQLGADAPQELNHV
jgi:RNA polymerase sigma-70 factor, ECF subfamily